jgi:hypothetical protein
VQKTNKKTMTLPCRLTPEEFVARAHDLAKTTEDIGAEQARAESLKSQLKAALAELEARRSKLSAVVSRGEELRDVECEVVVDYEKGETYTVRQDTGEFFDRRPLRAEERQVSAL